VRRTLALGLVWLAAAVTAAVVAWQGVGLVGDQVTSRRPATLDAAQIDAALDESTTTTSAGEQGGPAPPADDAAAETQTFRVTGGSAALRFSPAGVTLLWATPDPGYEVRQEPGDRDGLRVEFEGASAESRIDAWWDGEPRSRVRDDGRDSGHDDD
jgi:hypothetical protein